MGSGKWPDQGVQETTRGQAEISGTRKCETENVDGHTRAGTECEDLYSITY